MMTPLVARMELEGHERTPEVAQYCTVRDICTAQVHKAV
jgi:hypothetical protein